MLNLFKAHDLNLKLKNLRQTQKTPPKLRIILLYGGNSKPELDGENIKK